MNKKIWLLASIAIILLVIAPFFGIVPIDFQAIFKSNPGSFIFWFLRVPRALLGFVAGAILALSGLVCQNLFKNNLATPDLLGISVRGSRRSRGSSEVQPQSHLFGRRGGLCFFFFRSSFSGFVHFYCGESNKKFLPLYVFNVGSGDQFFLFFSNRLFSVHF